jgi:hypothetical protein
MLLRGSYPGPQASVALQCFSPCRHEIAGFHHEEQSTLRTRNTVIWETDQTTVTQTEQLFDQRRKGFGSLYVCRPKGVFAGLQPVEELHFAVTQCCWVHGAFRFLIPITSTSGPAKCRRWFLASDQ